MILLLGPGAECSGGFYTGRRRGDGKNGQACQSQER